MKEGYLTAADSTMPGLSAEHRLALVEGSAIAPEVIEERGVRTVRKGRGQLPSVYSRRQKRRAPGILFTIHRLSGDTCTVFRPDAVDPANPGHKYEQETKALGGSGNVLDVHPSIRHLIEEPSAPIVFVEGIKKADSITTAARAAGMDLLVVAISGVWNWMSEGEPISDMFDIPVSGRRTIICFDSDMVRKPEVQDAAERLAQHLTGRNGEVEVVHFPDLPDGSKAGADDFLASGGTLEDLLALIRPYRPGDLHRERLSRSERLRRSLDYLKRREEDLPSRTRRQCSRRAAWRAIVSEAKKRGELVGDGVEIAYLSSRTGAEMAAISQPTFSACMVDLEAEGFIRRGERDTKEQATPYVLLVPGGVFVYQDGEKGGPGEPGEERERDGEGESSLGDKELPPLPEMRWAATGRKARRGMVKGTRMVRQGQSLPVEGIYRLGKKLAEIVRFHLERGGKASREDLLEMFGGETTTWRDFKKQTLAPLLGRRRSYRGQALSVGPPILELTPEGTRLVENWREALAEHRILGQEEEAAMQQKAKHLRQRSAFLRRHEHKADRAKTEEEMDEDREERERRNAGKARVERLVCQGMARHVAVREVYDADGFIGDLASMPEEVSPPGDPPPDPSDTHPLSCDCPGCSAPRSRYATPYVWSEKDRG